MSSSLRVTQACNQCRSKKRRCDGVKPKCRLCVRLGIECNYAEFDGRSRRVNTNARARTTKEKQTNNAEQRSPSSNLSPVAPTVVIGETERAAAVNATSGVLSVDLVAKHIGSEEQTSNRVQIAPWNLGLGRPLSVCEGSDLQNVIDWDDLNEFAQVYFIEIHPLFGTFSEHKFWTKAEALRIRPEPNDYECYELIVFGVFALGSLFAHGVAPEDTLLDCWGRHLNKHLMRDATAMLDVDALILRTLYLRLTLGPRASWVSSCVLMSVLQDVPLQYSKYDRQASATENNASYDPRRDSGQKRQLVAKLLGAWISNECGRPRPFENDLPQSAIQLPERIPDTPCWNLLRLYNLSEALNPRGPVPDRVSLEKLLVEVLDFTFDHDVVIISQANLAVATFRRLRSISASLSPDLSSRLSDVGISGLYAVERLVARHQPWHHVANVPFQVLCLFLLLDTPESTSYVANALSTIKHVAEVFNSHSMQTTLQLAVYLVKLAQKRKQDDVTNLSSALTKNGILEDGQKAEGQQTGDVDAMDLADIGDLATASALQLDFDHWDDIDWEQIFAGENYLGMNLMS